jgi:hypothetical protein
MLFKHSFECFYYYTYINPQGQESGNMNDEQRIVFVDECLEGGGVRACVCVLCTCIYKYNAKVGRRAERPYIMPLKGKTPIFLQCK